MPEKEDDNPDYIPGDFVGIGNEAIVEVAAQQVGNVEKRYIIHLGKAIELIIYKRMKLVTSLAGSFISNIILKQIIVYDMLFPTIQ